MIFLGAGQVLGVRKNYSRITGTFILALKDVSFLLIIFLWVVKNYSWSLKDSSGELKDISRELKDISGKLKNTSGGLKNFIGS